MRIVVAENFCRSFLYFILLFLILLFIANVYFISSNNFFMDLILVSVLDLSEITLVSK